MEHQVNESTTPPTPVVGTSRVDEMSTNKTSGTTITTTTAANDADDQYAGVVKTRCANPVLDEYAEYDQEDQRAEDPVDRLLASDMDLLSLVEKSSDPDHIEKGWIEQSKKFYDYEMSQQDKRYLLLTQAPKTNEEWEALCVKVFGDKCLELRKTDFCFARNHPPEKPVKTGQELFSWLQTSEEYMLKGARTVDWTDPQMDQNYEQRPLHDVVPLGVGYDYAVIMASQKATPTKWSLYCARLTASNPRYVNSVTRSENMMLLGDREENNKRLAALRQLNTVAYVKGGCGNFERPVHGATHGKVVSLFWSGPERKNADLMRIYKLPSLSAQNVIELEFPAGRVTHYDLHWPLLVFACSNQYLFDAPWVKGLRNAANFTSVSEISPSCDLIVVVDLQEHILLRAWDAIGKINCLELSPNQTAVSHESVPLEDVKVLWNVDVPEDPIKDKTTFEDYVLQAKSTDIGADYLWRPIKDEMRLKTECNQTFRSKPNEPSRMIHRSLEGHTVQISDNNASVKVVASTLFPVSQLYYTRECRIVDRTVHLNSCYTMQHDYAVQFACLRAAKTEDAMNSVSLFSLKNLVDYGESPNKQYPPPKRMFYKAIWTSVDRVVFQFQDGTLLFSHAMTPTELARRKKQIAEARHAMESKNATKELVEKKTMNAILEAEHQHRAEVNKTKKGKNGSKS